MDIRSLDEAPVANDYLKVIEREAQSRDFRPVAAGELQLTAGGLLHVGGEPLEVSDDVRADLAKLARIPASYFSDISPDLRAINFNARLPFYHGQDEALEVAVSNDNAVHRVERPRFGRLRVPLAIEALLDGVPSDTVSNDIRVIE